MRLTAKGIMEDGVMIVKRDTGSTRLLRICFSILSNGQLYGHAPLVKIGKRSISDYVNLVTCNSVRLRDRLVKAASLAGYRTSESNNVYAAIDGRYIVAVRCIDHAIALEMARALNLGASGYWRDGKYIYCETRHVATCSTLKIASKICG